MVYKKQIVADGLREVKPYDTTQMFRTISSTAREISDATAKLAEQTFMNNFEVEQRKMLADSYERNMNNPAQLEAEQRKIKLNLVKALPNSKMRNEAMARFEIHAMPYVQKAKENLYKQKFEEAQASTIASVDMKINDMTEKAASLYSPDLALAGTSIQAFGLDISDLGNMVAQRDERGNAYFTPAQIAASKAEVRKIMTEGAVGYFDSLDAQGMKDFYKNYKEKTVEMNFVSADDPSGFAKQKMTNENTDWEQYEKNLAYMGKVIDEMEKQEKKGKAEKDALAFGVSKVKVAERLGVTLQTILTEDEIDPYKVLSFLEEVDDLTTNAKTAYTNQDGSVSFYLEPKDMYEYKEKLYPVWEDIMEKLNDSEKKTNFGYGLNALAEKYDNIAKSHGLNDFDRMDIAREYFRQLKATGISMNDRVSVMSNKAIAESVENAFRAFVMRSNKIKQSEKNRILSTPTGIKTTYIPAGEQMSKIRY